MEFENNGGIWGFQPFLEYVDIFEDDFGYSISASESNGILGSKTYYYNVKVFRIKETGEQSWCH